jgi:hypothetical protein
MNDHLRHTGRSFNLLSQALSYAIEQLPITYYVKDRNHRAIVERQWHDVCREHYREHYRSDRVPRSLIIRELPEDFDWRHMQPAGIPGYSHEQICFVDHYVVEQQIAELQERVTKLNQLIAQLQPYAAGAPQPVNIQIELARRHREQLRKEMVFKALKEEEIKAKEAEFEGERDTTSEGHNE